MSSPPTQHATPFRVPDQTLWPPICPACGYLLRGLPAPRCPECGERADEGEVVIVGVPLHPEGGFGDSWFQGLVIIVVAALGGGILIVWREGLKPDVPIVLAVCVVAMLLLHTLHWRWRRRRGIPAGIIRISKDGYRFGAGDLRGSLRPWPKRLSILTQQRPSGVLRLRAVIFLGPIPARPIFDIFTPLTPEQLEGLLERIRAWSPGRLDIRR